MARIPWLADAARATGHPVIEVSQWQTRGTTLFAPKGLLWHHTAGPVAGDMPSLNILINGRAGLPGPLSQYGLGRSGTIYVVAAGRANHAGHGGWNGLIGNGSVIGIEAEHTGKSTTPWPVAQLDAYRKLSAQILTRLGTTVENMCGHKEWAPTRKVDPISLVMVDERARVDVLMQGNGGEDMRSLRLAVAEAGNKGWLTATEVTYWMGKANTPDDPEWQDFEDAWSGWKQTEWKQLQGHPHGAPTTGGVTETRVKQLIAATKLTP